MGGEFVDGMWYHETQFERDAKGDVKRGPDGRPVLLKGAQAGEAGVPDLGPAAIPQIDGSEDASSPSFMLPADSPAAEEPHAGVSEPEPERYTTKEVRKGG